MKELSNLPTLLSASRQSHQEVFGTVGFARTVAPRLTRADTGNEPSVSTDPGNAGNARGIAAACALAMGLVFVHHSSLEAREPGATTPDKGQVLLETNPRVAHDRQSMPQQTSAHTLAMVPPASDPFNLGFIRITNRSDRAGTVQILATSSASPTAPIAQERCRFWQSTIPAGGSDPCPIRSTRRRRSTSTPSTWSSEATGDCPEGSATVPAIGAWNSPPTW